MKQIPINCANGLCPTLMSSAFGKARVEYFLGQGTVWAYPAIMTIQDDTEKQTFGSRNPQALAGAD